MFESLRVEAEWTVDSKCGFVQVRSLALEGGSIQGSRVHGGVRKNGLVRYQPAATLDRDQSPN